MSTAYQKGAQFEYKVKAYLEEIGYKVFRIAGSHSPADLIAMSKGNTPDGLSSEFTWVWMIQCQRSKYFSRKKTEALLTLAGNVNASYVLCWFEDDRTRENTSIHWSDDTIVQFAPKPPNSCDPGSQKSET